MTLPPVRHLPTRALVFSPTRSWAGLRGANRSHAGAGVHKTATPTSATPRSWPTREEARSAVVYWIEAVYNRRRRHSAIGMMAPMAFERWHHIRSDAA